MHEVYLDDMHSKYVYPNVFMSIDDTNRVSQLDTDIKKYAEQKKADWILNGGIEEEWDEYLQKMEDLRPVRIPPDQAEIFRQLSGIPCGNGSGIC